MGGLDDGLVRTVLHQDGEFERVSSRCSVGPDDMGVCNRIENDKVNRLHNAAAVEIAFAGMACVRTGRFRKRRGVGTPPQDQRNRQSGK